MKKLLSVACAAGVAVAVPATAIGANPSSSDHQNAAKYCKQLRAASPDANSFASAVRAVVAPGTKVTAKNAYGKCVSAQSRNDAADTTQNQQQAQQNAAQKCRAEQSQDSAAFDQKYGTNPNKKNAFGKCVSQQSSEGDQQLSQQSQQENDNELNAARTCKTQRKSDRAAFAAKWGSKPNAFGKCVSSTAKQSDQQQQEQGSGS